LKSTSLVRLTPVLAGLNAQNRSKSPFSIGALFSIIGEFTVRFTIPGRITSQIVILSLFYINLAVFCLSLDIQRASSVIHLA
jgi:hypothetical protein